MEGGRAVQRPELHASATTRPAARTSPARRRSSTSSSARRRSDQGDDARRGRPERPDLDRRSASGYGYTDYGATCLHRHRPDRPTAITSSDGHPLPQQGRPRQRPAQAGHDPDRRDHRRHQQHDRHRRGRRPRRAVPQPLRRGDLGGRDGRRSAAQGRQRPRRHAATGGGPSPTAPSASPASPTTSSGP